MDSSSSDSGSNTKEKEHSGYLSTSFDSSSEVDFGDDEGISSEVNSNSEDEDIHFFLATETSTNKSRDMVHPFHFVNILSHLNTNHNTHLNTHHTNHHNPYLKFTIILTLIFTIILTLILT